MAGILEKEQAKLKQTYGESLFDFTYKETKLLLEKNNQDENTESVINDKIKNIENNEDNQQIYAILAEKAKILQNPKKTHQKPTSSNTVIELSTPKKGLPRPSPFSQLRKEELSSGGKRKTKKSKKTRNLKKSNRKSKKTRNLKK
jgi:hypothetical protein